MQALGVITGIIVGVVFVGAGIFKLADGDAWPKQAADMGVRRQIAVFVPWVEIVLGVLTAVHILGPLPAVMVLLMLVAFTGIIVMRLLDGSRPPCACFGSRSARPLGMYHVVRNLVLAALTLVTIAAA